MLNVTSKLWNETDSDYKLIIKNQRYIMLTADCLQPCEIDNENGVRRATISVSGNNENLSDCEKIHCFYNPLLSKVENLRNALKRYSFHENILIAFFLECGYIKESDLIVSEY